MIDLFLTETPAGLIELAAATARDDLAALADTAYTFKGRAGHFCTELLNTGAANLEHDARHDEQSDFPHMTRIVTNAAAGLTDALRQKPGGLL